METWTWIDMLAYFICTAYLCLRNLSLEQNLIFAVKFFWFLLGLPLRALREFTIIACLTRSPDRPYTTFFEFSALEYTRWILSTFQAGAIHSVFFSDTHARMLYALRKFKYGTENIGDFEYEPVDSAAHAGYWVRSRSRRDVPADLVIYFVPGCAVGSGSAYFYIEFLCMLLVELQVHGFRHPVVFCVDAKSHELQGFAAYMQKVVDGYKYVRAAAPTARHLVMGSGVGGTAALSLLLHLARSDVGIGGVLPARASTPWHDGFARQAPATAPSMLTEIDEASEKVEVPAPPLLSPEECEGAAISPLVLPCSLSSVLPTDISLEPRVELAPDTSVCEKMCGGVSEALPLEAVLATASSGLASVTTSATNGDATTSATTGREAASGAAGGAATGGEATNGTTSGAATSNAASNGTATSNAATTNAPANPPTTKVATVVSPAPAQQKKAVCAPPDAAFLISPFPHVEADRVHTRPDFVTPLALQQLGLRLDSEKCIWAAPGNVRDRQWWRKATPRRGIYMMYGERETARPEIEQFVKRLQNAQTCRIVASGEPTQVHAWPITSAYLGRCTTDQKFGIMQCAEHIANMLVIDCIFDAE